MKIENRGDLNRYYNILNELIDNYIDKWKIRPTRLKEYLKFGSKRMSNFLKRNDLDGIEGVEKVLKDIINDRVHMELDGVMTFESYHENESEYGINSMGDAFYKGIEKADLSQEKILADIFDTGLSAISIIDSDKHLFEIDSWERVKEVIIYSKEELLLIRRNIFEFILNNLKEREIKLTDHITFNINNVLDINKLKNELKKKFNRKYMIEIVSDFYEFYFHKSEMGNFIWINKNN